jgi:hypothetical protein
MMNDEYQRFCKYMVNMENDNVINIPDGVGELAHDVDNSPDSVGEKNNFTYTIKFTPLKFRSLPNEAHYRFFDRAVKEIDSAGAAVKTSLGPLVGELKEWFAKETALVAWYGKSPLTDRIAEAKKYLDRILVGLFVQVRSLQYSTEQDVAAAADRLNIMLRSYGRVIRKPYMQEAGAVQSILAHLNGDLAGDVRTAGVERQVADAGNALTGFVALMEAREAQSLKKPQQSFRRVQHDIEKVWHQIVKLVNSGAALNVSPDFETLINALNPEIEYLNSEFHYTRHSIKAARLASIVPQPYSGEACTPVPEVFFNTPKKTLTLELGKDFNISYRNNINPGNAECTVHGKGKYKDSKTVTFIIYTSNG